MIPTTHKYQDQIMVTINHGGLTPGQLAAVARAVDKAMYQITEECDIEPEDWATEVLFRE